MDPLKNITLDDIANENIQSIANDLADFALLSAKKSIQTIHNQERLRTIPRVDSNDDFLLPFLLNDYKNEILTTGNLETVNRPFLNLLSAGKRTLLERTDLNDNAEMSRQIRNLFPEKFSFSQNQRTLDGNWQFQSDSELIWKVPRLFCNLESDKDHVYLQGLKIDPYGNSEITNQLDLEGGWDTGNHVNWTDKVICSTKISTNNRWPQSYTLVLMLSVNASSELTKAMHKIADIAQKEITEYITATAGAYLGAKVGAAIGAGFGPVGLIAGIAIGAIVGAITAFVIGKLFQFFKDLFSDKKLLLGPNSFTVDLPYHGNDLTGETLISDQKAKFVNEAKYTLYVQTSVRWKDDFVPVPIKLPNNKVDVVRIRHSQFQSNSIEHNLWTNWITDSNFTFSSDSIIHSCAKNRLAYNLFAVGLDNKIWTKTTSYAPIRIPGSQIWSPVLDAVFPMNSGIASASKDSGSLDIFVIGYDGHVWTAALGHQTDYKWAGWWNLEGATFLPGTSITAVSRSKNILDIFTIGLDGYVYSNSYDANVGSWSGWFTILANRQFVSGSPITVISRKENQLDLFICDENGLVYTAEWHPDSGWQGWKKITDNNGEFPACSIISVTSHSEDNIDVFALGLDGRLWTAAKGPQTQNAYAGWWPVGDETFVNYTPLTAISPEPYMLQVFLKGKDNLVNVATFRNNSWSWGKND